MISFSFDFCQLEGKITVFQLGYIFEYEFNRRNFLVCNQSTAVVGGAFKEWVLRHRIIAFAQE